MTRDPVSVRDDGAAVEALDRMVENGIRHLPVVDAARKVLGILSVDDLRAALPFDVSTARPPGPVERREAQTYRVSDAMTWAPRTVRASESLEEAVRCLAEHRIGCLPVVDEGERLEGILSETDALHALDSLLRREPPPPAARASGGPKGLVDALWAEREGLVEQLAKWQAAGRSLSADLHDRPHDRAERAADESGVAELDTISARATQRLRSIERALERAETGRFGICERCQGRIPAPRLRALPETTLCVACARVTARASAEL
jgi:CBS domain-containing protein